MKRKAIDTLIEWKTSDDGKVLLLTGAKGVGKTYLAYDFARAFFKHCIYVNYERNINTHYFDTMEQLNRIQMDIINPNIEEERPLVILDEVGYTLALEDIIQMIRNSGITPFILTISSKEIVMNERMQDGFKTTTIYPLDFDEFLLATSNEWYIEAIYHHYETNQKMPEIVHEELLALHGIYMRIGGIPAVVNDFISFQSDVNVVEQQSLFLSSYRDYILKNFAESEAYKMLQVYDVIPAQLLKDNRKFQYKLIRKGATHNMYQGAVDELSHLQYILPVHKLNDDLLLEYGHNRLKGLEELKLHNTNYKIYCSDAGLLFSRIRQENLLDHQLGNQLLLENYVAQSMISKKYQLGFWESGSMAKVDYIGLKDNDDILPIEVYATENTRSKSVHMLKQKVSFPYALKISKKNFEYSNHIKYVPPYAVFCI